MKMLKNTSRALMWGSWILYLTLILKNHIVAGLITFIVMFTLGSILDLIHMDLEFKKQLKDLDDLFKEVNEKINKPLKGCNSILDIHFERINEIESKFDIKGNCDAEDVCLVIVAIAKAAVKNSPLEPEMILDHARELYLDNTKMVEK